jgi:hypothetical protein
MNNGDDVWRQSVHRSDTRAMASMYAPRQSIWLDGLPASQDTTRQTDRQTDRQVGRQADRQKDKQQEDKDSWKGRGLENTQVSFH